MVTGRWRSDAVLARVRELAREIETRLTHLFGEGWLS
jgi:hypothetical protein